MSLLSLHSPLHAPNSVRRWIFGHPKEPARSVEALLLRMRQRHYRETLPVLASCWLRTLCCGGHNRVWWAELDRAVKHVLRKEALDPFSHDVLLSVQRWVEGNVLAGSVIPAGQHIEPPFRSVPVERLVPYVCRLLNEWLPAEIAYLLTAENEFGTPRDGGDSGLAAARALDRLLVRERLSPETLEALIAPGLLSSRLVYPADAEILRDAALARLGRVDAPAPSILPATLLGVVADAALPAGYEEAVRGAALVGSAGREELRVPIAAAAAVAILRSPSTRIGSVLVTMDGRAWHASKLHAGDQAMVVYTPEERLRIDFSADHAKLTVPWPEAPSHWFGGVPLRGPFEVFGREWRTASWEMDRNATSLHLTFSRVLPVAETPEPVDTSPRLPPAYVDMAWSEVERALSDARLRNSRDPVEQMRRAELIPLTRALYALAASVHGDAMSNGKQIETQLGAVRYHLAAVTPVYGRAQWRVLPPAVQKALLTARLNRPSTDLLIEIFSDLPNGFPGTMRPGGAQAPAHPPQAA